MCEIRKIRDDLLLIHAEDAAFALSQRALAAEAPNYRLIDLYDLEQRLIGHLDALVLADKAGLEIAEAEAVSGDLDAVAVLTHVALRQRHRNMIAKITFPDGDLPTLCRRIAEAAMWYSHDELALVMSDWINGSVPFRMIALEICSLRRIDPRHYLTIAITDADPMIQARAITLAGELGRTDCLSQLREIGGDEADLAAVRLGDDTAARRLFDVDRFPARSQTARCFAETLPLVLPREEAIVAVRGLLEEPATRRWGVVAIGALGWMAGLQGLLAVMSEPLHARVAVSAFEQITGLYVAHEDLEMKDFPEDPEGPLIGILESFIDANTPWPDVERFGAWLEQNASRYSEEERLLLGVAAWTFKGTPEPWVKYQARHRWVATSQALQRPDAMLPNHISPVYIEGTQFTRSW